MRNVADKHTAKVVHFDEEEIEKLINEGAIRKVILDEKENGKTSTVTVNFNPGPSRIQAVKFIKELFGLSLVEAKNTVDAGVILIPEGNDVVNFVKGLYNVGGCVTGGCIDYVVAQAAIFFNGKYPGNLQGEQLIKDFAMASYHNRTNSTDDEEKALLNAIDIVKEHPSLACKWMDNEGLVKIITML